MTSSTDVVVSAGRGGRLLLRTAAALARQRARAASIAVVKSAAHPDAPLIESTAARLSAAVVEPGVRPGGALNAAVRGGTGRYVLVLPAGLMPHEHLIERCESILGASGSLGAVALTIALRTADGAEEWRWVPEGLTTAAVLADTRSAPPAFAVRRGLWDAVGGADETLEGLVEYALWLRLLGAGSGVWLLDEPMLLRDPADRDPAEDDEQHLRYFRAVLERHADAVEREMIDVLVAREVRFGRLRQVHRDLLAQRDRALAELDRLRAAAAHDRAYLAHHGHERLDWGDFRRTDPLSRDWGYDRGVPVDRRYIDEFLAAHSSDVRGAVLEVQEDDFTVAFGGPRVTDRAVLDVDRSNPRATVLADLRAAPDIPTGSFDCVILTQTLHVIDDMPAVLGECHRILKPDGVLLATLPSASRVCLEYGEQGDFWRMTPAGARALVAQAFAPAVVDCDVFGNVLTSTAFLHGLGAAELTDAEFAATDPYFPALTGVRAKKSSRRLRAGARGAVLLYHRVDGTPDVHGLGIAPALFESQLEWLRAECCVLPLDELLGTPHHRLPDRAVALTFDDGYEDNLRVAVPLLQRYGAAAAFFLTSRWLDSPGEYWWDTLERVLLSGADTPAVLEVEAAGARLRLATGDAPGRLAAHSRLHDLLVHASRDDRDRVVESVRAWGGGGPARVRPMTADAVRQLAAQPGVLVGAHSVNHLALPDHPGSQLLEINECRAALERVTGGVIDTFAYPYGALDRQTAALVRRVCRWGLSCDSRVLGDSFDAARVPRLDVKSWDRAEFASRVGALFEPGGSPRRRALTW